MMKNSTYHIMLGWIGLAILLFTAEFGTIDERYVGDFFVSIMVLFCTGAIIREIKKSRKSDDG